MLHPTLGAQAPVDTMPPSSQGAIAIASGIIFALVLGAIYVGMMRLGGVMKQTVRGQFRVLRQLCS